MSMKEWARHEVELACKRENPNWDGKSFDYGCSCYQSALKAYELLMDDGHSGYSFSITRNILEKLLNSQPLTPITDDDFPNRDQDNSKCEYTYEYATGKKSSIQCPRMSSLFRYEDLNGNVTYHDIDRAYCQDVEFPSDTYHSGMICDVIDEIDPITMPYSGTKNKWVIYTTTFLCDKTYGDYDHHSIEYIKGPDGKIYDIQRYWKEDYSGRMVECSKEEYEYDKKHLRIDRITDKIFNLIYNDICDSLEEGTTLNDEQTSILYKSLRPLCEFFEDCESRHRTYGAIHRIVDGQYECNDESVEEDMNKLMNFIGEFMSNLTKNEER